MPRNDQSPIIGKCNVSAIEQMNDMRRQQQAVVASIFSLSSDSFQV